MTAFILEFTVLHLKIPHQIHHFWSLSKNPKKKIQKTKLWKKYELKLFVKESICCWFAVMLNGLRLIVSNTVIGEETLYRQGPSVEVYKLQVHKVSWLNQLACRQTSLKKWRVLVIYHLRLKWLILENWFNL